MRKQALCFVAAVVVFSTLAVAADVGVKDIPLRLKKAQQGEWAEYKTASGMTQKQTIIEIAEKDGDTSFSVKMELIMDGESLQSMVHVFYLNDAISEQEEMAGEEGVTVTRGSETINGKDMEVFFVESEIEGSKIQTVMSEDIPVTGIVRVVIDGETLLEIDRFGETAEE